MPFKSKSQMRAAFSGALGPVMKKKATTWAKHTPNIKSLPNRVHRKSSMRPGMKYGMKNPKRR